MALPIPLACWEQENVIAKCSQTISSENEHTNCRILTVLPSSYRESSSSPSSKTSQIRLLSQTLGVKVGDGILGATRWAGQGLPANRPAVLLGLLTWKSKSELPQNYVPTHFALIDGSAGVKAPQLSIPRKHVRKYFHKYILQIFPAEIFASLVSYFPVSGFFVLIFELFFLRFQSKMAQFSGTMFRSLVTSFQFSDFFFSI